MTDQSRLMPCADAATTAHVRAQAPFVRLGALVGAVALIFARFVWGTFVR